MRPVLLLASALVLALPAATALPSPGVGTGSVCDAVTAPDPVDLDEACGAAACQFLVPAGGIPLPVWPSEYGISVGDSSGSLGLLDCHLDLGRVIEAVEQAISLEPVCPYLPQACGP